MGMTVLTDRGASLKRMTDKERAFVHEYIKDHNGTQAAIRAGYAKKSAQVTAAQILKRPHIAAAIGKIDKQMCESAKITAELVLEQLYYILTRESHDFVDESDRIRPLHTMNKRAAACIDGIKQKVRTWIDEDGNTNEVVETEIKITPKVSGVDMAMKYKGLFAPEQHEHLQKLMQVVDWKPSGESLQSAADMVEQVIESTAKRIEAK